MRARARPSVVQPRCCSNALSASLAAIAILASCDAARDIDSHQPASDATPISVVDDGGRSVVLSRPASRVLSLIPSATESIVAIGGAAQLVGRTRYDVHSTIAHLPSVGGANDPSLEVITSLRPDLVVLWNNADHAPLRVLLDRRGVPSFAIRTTDTADVMRTINSLGKLLGRGAAADSLLNHIHDAFAEIQRSVRDARRPSVFFLLWNDPPLTAAPDTFIGQLISLAGGNALFQEMLASWPAVSLEEILRRDPDIIVLPVGAMRPTTLQRLRETPGWRKLRAVRDGHVFTIPADLSNRPGPNIVSAARLLRDSIRFHGEVIVRDSIRSGGR